VPPLCRRCEVADNQNTSCIPAVVTTSPCRSLYGEILHLLKCVFLHQEKYRSPQSTVLGACGLVRASSSSHLPRTAFYCRRFCRLRGIVCRQTISVCRLFIFEVDSRLVPYDIHVSSSSLYDIHPSPPGSIPLHLFSVLQKVGLLAHPPPRLSLTRYPSLPGRPTEAE